MAHDGGTKGKQPVPTTDSEKALDAAEASNLADEAEAEATEAEALAAAARARARAIRLRRQAQKAEAAPADETEAEDVTVDAPRKRPRGRRRPKRKTIAAAAAIVLICASLGVSGYMIWVDREEAQTQHRAAEYASAARQGVINLMSLDYNHAKEDVQRAIDSTTGDFRRDFQATSDDWVKMMTQSKVATTATVTAIAVDPRTVTDKSADVLVAARTDVTNSAGAKEDPRSWRLAVTVVRDGDQIKMSKVDFVQ